VAEADYLLQRGSVARVPSGAKPAANPVATSTNALTTRPLGKARSSMSPSSPGDSISYLTVLDDDPDNPRLH
jgi:hypothetical protein